FHLELQEYPKTLEDGIAYVYSVSAFDNKKAREFFNLKNI
ncbi:13764_t:CDS:1, partial [Rhizophagus irregularis]